MKKVLVIGSGGIVIAQAAEFDYSGSQALKALREEGIETVLVNPNVATIQTSMRMADKVYLEPCTPEFVAQILKKERPDGILLGFGGQTALNVGVQLARSGILDELDVRVLGTSIRSIEITEDRLLFKKAMEKAGVPIPSSDAAYSVDEALEIADRIGYPVIVRTAYMLGGGGSGKAYNPKELSEIVEKALEWSFERQVLIERYLEHWKEIEYEVMRDYADNTITIAALENFDPLGIHTGDSIVVAPTQTLTNREYQILRDASIRVIRGVGVVGECNIQFGLDPNSEDYMAIEVNPRMSRSSALASKATGYPLAYIAAKLAIGYTLPELINKATGVTTACFEPALDYVVVKIPRWDFNKFPGPVDRRLGSMMKSVGEVMSVARSFEEALQKAVRELEIGKIGLVGNPEDDIPEPIEKLKDELANPTDERLFKIAKALKQGLSVDEIHKLSGVDRWFLYKIKNIVDMERKLKSLTFREDDEGLAKCIREAKRLGFSDKQIAKYLKVDELDVRRLRKKFGIVPSFKIIDTMAAEWPSQTNYCYLTYGDTEDDVKFEKKKKVLVLGAGCIRIGSSVEFDYCTMHTAWSMKEEGIEEVIVVNNNPETVSTDYDMSDKLYFEEITLERVLDIIDKEKPMGVVVSVGGQTPNNLALPLAKLGVKLIGTSAESIDTAEDRSKFSALLDRLKIPQPIWSSHKSLEDAILFAEKIGYPVLVRPSYVLSGAAMRVARNEEELKEYLQLATKVSPEHPVVISKFFENAKEVEVDAVSDGKHVLIGAVIEHIELAGTHSGDAVMVIPPQTLPVSVISRIEYYTRILANALKIKGPFNIQFLVKDGVVYIIELNLRASRSMPYTSKSTGIPLLWIAGKVMLGKTLLDLRLLKSPKMLHVSVKAPTFSFMRLKGADPVLGVEMTSTGEVACMDYDFASALIKALIASNMRVPKPNQPVLITVRKEDYEKAVSIAKKLSSAGYPIYATKGTAEVLKRSFLDDVKVFKKIHELDDDDEGIIESLSKHEIGMVINTPHVLNRNSIDDNYKIRRTAVEFFIPVITRIETAEALADALIKMGGELRIRPRPLDEYLVGSRFLRYI
ncbi:carbamoyl-phosphate synthase (glutamine-hydrolyzing) large subunit [Candidatus Bathyarchaeota archaeon]|nr:MAG: carbamoyl-phosphate synthase (glutamine-hydrolyzing) large subunit [Candidatus Bathyarchaeota archaeon]